MSRAIVALMIDTRFLSTAMKWSISVFFARTAVFDFGKLSLN